MTTTALRVPTHAELVARGRDLQPLLRKHVTDGEVYRRQADEVIETLTAAGLFRLFTPRRFGGYSTSLRTQVDVTEALAEADGSAAWVVGIATGGAWVSAHATQRAQEEIFGPDPDVRIAGSGMPAPVLAVGDGALGFWKAVREVFPDTREQRCCWHRQANVLAALPKSAQPGALAALKEIYNAEDIDKAQLAIKAFEIDYGAKYPKAVAKIVDDADVLLEFYRYPAEHWIHLRTTNPIESTFATVRLRTKVTKGPGSRAAGLAMAYKLIEAAQTRWRAVNAPHLVALVRAGAVFHKGKLLERPIDITPEPSTAEPATVGSEVA
jgi:hypothetical protein